MVRRATQWLQFILKFTAQYRTELVQLAALGLGAFAISMWSLPAALLVVAIVVIYALEVR